MIVLGNENECNINNLYSDNVYKQARYFNNIKDAVDFAYKSLSYYFKDSFIKDYSVEFIMGYSLDEIKKLSEDAKNIENDILDLAYIKNNNSEYFADLVVFGGKFGLMICKYFDDQEWDTLTFIECKLDMSSSSSLLSSMKQKLDNFIDEELEHEISIGI